MSAVKPKYIQIAEKISKLIESGELKAGQNAPSENRIISEYDVSNTTARKALLELELIGLVSRVKGKGTVVLENSKGVLTRVIGSFDAIGESFAENLKKDGLKGSVKIAERTVFRGKVSASINGSFYELSGRIYKIRVLRYGGKILLKDEERFFDADLCSGVEELGDIDPFIGTLSKKCGVEIGRVDRSFSAKVANAKEDADFGFIKPSALIVMEGASFDGNGKLAEIERSLYRADKYKFAVGSGA